MLSWIPLSDRKTLPTPKIVLRDMDFCGGYYSHRTERRCIDTLADFDLKDGDLIVLSTHWGEPTASTIAHEHRHLQQNYLQSVPKLRSPVVACPPAGCTYEEWAVSIRQYFRRQYWEMDALLYERRLAPSESNETMLRVARGMA